MSDLIQIDPRSLKPYPANYNTHPAEQIDELARSLNEFDQPKNIVIWQGHILAGHGLAEAAIKAGRLAIEARDVSYWPQEKAEAFLIADNETARMGQPDYARLNALLEMARAAGQNVPGVTEARLAEIVAEARRAGNGSGPVEPEAPPIDRAEELQAKWQVKAGDIWQMDQHFIICGDCREPETWQRLLDAAGLDKVNGVFTSPPYAEQRKAQYGGVPTAEYVQWWGAVQTNVRAALAGDGSFFVNIKPHCEDGQRVLYVFDLVLAMVRQWGWRFVDELCWVRPGVPGQWKNRHRNSFEPIFHFSQNDDLKFYPQNNAYYSEAILVNSSKISAKVDANNGKYWNRSNLSVPGLANPDNVLNIASSDTGFNHAAAFPVALPTFFLKAYSDPGDSWVDPFCGSGTVLVACQNEGRIGLGIERLEKYCAVILQRLLQLTSQEPRLLSHRETL